MSHNPVGLVIVPDSEHPKPLIGIRSFLSDDTDKSMIIIDNSLEHTASFVSDIEGEIIPAKTMMGKVNNTQILYVWQPPASGLLSPSCYKKQGLDIINTYLRNDIGFLLVMKPNHIYKEGFVDKINEYLYSYPEIGAVYCDYIVTGNIERSGRQYLPPFKHSEIKEQVFIHNNIAIKGDIIPSLQVDTAIYTLEDYDLALRISIKRMLVHIPEPLYSTDGHIFTGVNEQYYKYDIKRIKTKFTQN